MTDFDQHELHMLRILQDEGRKPVSELASQVGLSTTPCARRFEGLRNAGVITGFGARLDRQAIGLGIEVFVGVNLTMHDGRLPEQFRQQVQRLDAVTACWAVTGEQDFVLHVMLPDVAALNHFLMHELQRIEGVRDVRTNLVLHTVKQPGRLPLDHLRPV